jgi:glycosyltransferase involved in cell wall biosynthesis
MDVSIAICTRDRAASLARTLDSLSAMSIPDGLEWEVVVVNNAARDDTDSVIAGFRHGLPLHREYEAAPGLSNARNRAVAALGGAYVIWTDDDVVVDRRWLAAYVEAFRERPDAAMFGGKIIPLFEEPVPGWLRECWMAVGHAYAFRDFGDEPSPITDLCAPYGANFAVRVKEQRAYLYNPELGAGTRIPTGEETDVIKRMLKDRLSGYWVPAATVQHCIPRARQTLRYLSDYYRAQGRCRAFQAGNARSRDGSRLCGRPRGLARQLIANCCHYLSRRWTMPSRVWIRHFVSYAMTRGEWDFYRRCAAAPADGHT